MTANCWSWRPRRHGRAFSAPAWQTDLRDGYLHVSQGKTKTKLRIEITGQLAIVLDRIEARKTACRAANKAVSIY